MTHRRVQVFPAPELFDRASDFVAGAIRRRIADDGACSIALSGGSTPVAMFRRLAAVDITWPVVDVFQVDERVAPPGHPERNLTLIERELRDRIDGEPPRIHAMDVTAHRLSEAQTKRGGFGGRSAPDRLSEAQTKRGGFGGRSAPDRLDDAAISYANALESVCGRPPVIDVVHLGLGSDGHTASLVPNDLVLDERDRWVSVTRPYGGYVRMTLTYPVLDNARLVVFLVVGADKADALAAMLAGDTEVPAGRLSASNVVVFADPASAER